MDIKYEERLVCFIDVLGFKAAIENSISEVEIRDNLHWIIHELKAEKVKREFFNGFPNSLIFERHRKGKVSPRLVEKKSKTYKSTPDEERVQEVISQIAVKNFYTAFPLNISQFSDCFVISCPASNPTSCELLLQYVYIIHMMFFANLGMMMRGGITIGGLIHEENGALFGPAMNEAYELESKSAIYPRIVLSKKADEYIKSALYDSPILKPLITAFDDQAAIDLISILQWEEFSKLEPSYIEVLLKDMEKNVNKISKKAYPKIEYLLKRWLAREIY